MASSPASLEAPACAPADALGEPTDFPPLIQAALARVAGLDACGLAEMDSKERGLLARLVRNIDVRDPTASVRIRDGTLALALHVSERTVQRIKAVLVEKGWITRRQIQSRRLGMQVCDIWLTEHALRVLGLIAPKPSASARMADACSLSKEQSSLKRQVTDLERPEHCSETPRPAPAPAAPRSGAVPEDLELLAARGLSVPAIRKLMGQATAAGHRLGHIVRAARASIEAARRPFAYVRRLIASGRSWEPSTSHSAATCASEAPAPSSQHKEDEAALLLALPGGKLFSHAKRQYVWKTMGGVVFEARVEDFVASRGTHWHPCLRLPALAKLLRAGELHPVDAAAVSSWPHAPDPAGPPAAALPRARAHASARGSAPRPLLACFPLASA